MEIRPITYPQQTYNQQGALNTENMLKRVQHNPIPVPTVYPKVEDVTKTLGTKLDVRA